MKSSSISAKVNILCINIDRLTMKECIERIVLAANNRTRMRVVTANPEMVYRASFDPRLQEVINSADLVTPDGIGIVWAAKYLGNSVPERVTGIDLIQALLPYAHHHKWKVFLLGASPGVAEKAARKLAGDYPGILWGYEHGYFSEAEESSILQRVRDFQPHIFLVGLGVPRQEYWLYKHKDLASVSIGVGGSFDTLSGDKPRAPIWIQKLKLEWLYRLTKEPKRLKRQSNLPLFVIKVLKHKK